MKTVFVFLLTLLTSPALSFTPSATPKKKTTVIDPGFVQEAEFKHARVAMLSVPTLVALGLSGVEEPVKWLSQQPEFTQMMFFGTTGLIETTTSLSRLGPFFTLREGVVPGNYMTNRSDLNADLKSRAALELATGRVAMLSAAAMLASGAF